MPNKRHNRHNRQQNKRQEETRAPSVDKLSSLRLFHLDDIELLYHPAPVGAEIGMMTFRTTPSQIPLPNTAACRSGKLLTQAANDQHRKQMQSDGMEFVLAINIVPGVDTKSPSNGHTGDLNNKTAGQSKKILSPWHPEEDGEEKASTRDLSSQSRHDSAASRRHDLPITIEHDNGMNNQQLPQAVHLGSGFVDVWD